MSEDRSSQSPITETSAYYDLRKDTKILMAYIVDLICVMQVIFLSISGDRVTPDVVTFALQVSEEPRRIVHRCVDEFDVKSGLLDRRDYVLEKIVELIGQYSIPDDKIRGLKQRMCQVVVSSLIGGAR